MFSLFKVDRVKSVSAAAAGMCRWVHAVYWYSEISRKMKPKISELLQAEDELNKVELQIKLIAEKMI